MSDSVIYSIIYVSVIVASLILTYKLSRLYKDIKLPVFKLTIVMLAALIFLSIFTTVRLFHEVIAFYGQNEIDVLNVFAVLALSAEYLVLFYLVESVKESKLTWKFHLALLLAGGSVISEVMRSNDLLLVAGSVLEVLALLLLLWGIYDYINEIKLHVLDPRNFMLGMFGYSLTAFALLGKASFIFLYNALGVPVYLFLSNASSLLALMGVLVILYTMIYHPFSVMGVLVNPKILLILTKEGDVLYEYYFDRKIDNIEKKCSKDLLIGVHIAIRDMLEKDAYIQRIETSKLNIIGSVMGNTISLMLVDKFNIMLEGMLKAIHRIFEEDLSHNIKEGNLKEIDIDQLGRFDHIVKYYLSELVR